MRRALRTYWRDSAQAERANLVSQKTAPPLWPPVEVAFFAARIEPRLTFLLELWFNSPSHQQTRNEPAQTHTGPRRPETRGVLGQAAAASWKRWAQGGSTRSLMAPSQVARRCCLPHLRGICPAKEHLRAWAEAMRRQDPRRFPVRRSAVHGMGTPHGADTTETVLHVDAATRLPDAGMPLQEGHHISRAATGTGPGLPEASRRTLLM